MSVFLDYANRLLKSLMVVTIGLMVILVFLNVILRYCFNSGVDVTEELGRYLFVWLTFLGIISAFVRNTHIRVDSIVRCLPKNVQQIVGFCGDILMLVCCVLIVLGCWKLTALNWHNLLPISEIPVGMLYLAGIPCALCLAFMLLRRLALRLKGEYVEGEAK